MKELVIALIIGHFLLDWILQPRKMAKQKSSDFKTLLAHLAINFIGLLLITWAFSGISLPTLLLLNLINIITHGIIDWNIWTLAKNIMSRYQDEVKREYIFYSIIAIDQSLHLTILMLLFL